MSLSDGVGDHTYQPAAAADVNKSYELGVGNLRVDLSRRRIRARRCACGAKVGIGELKIIVPRTQR